MTAKTLLVRPGARFTCHADGLCCSSIHALGPVAGQDLIHVRRLARGAVTWHPDFHSYMMTTEAQRCVFLRRDRLCAVHTRLGFEKKPATCRKFPFALTTTPLGRRITTAHRCPCRTLGDRAPVDPASVERELRGAGKPLRSERVVRGRIPLSRGVRISFSSYHTLEERLLARLLAGEDALSVLGKRPFPRSFRGDWAAIAQDLHEPDDGSYYDTMRMWVGDAILHITCGLPFPMRARPWRRYFDRAERRAQVVRMPEAMINDWLADELWSMAWIAHGSLRRACHDWATRVAIIRSLSSALRRQGARRDRATAEAIMMVDAVCTAEHWEAAARGFPA